MNAQPRHTQVLSRPRQSPQIRDIANHRRQSIGHHVAMREAVIAAEHHDWALNARTPQFHSFFDQ